MSEGEDGVPRAVSGSGLRAVRRLATRDAAAEEAKVETSAKVRADASAQSEAGAEVGARAGVRAAAEAARPRPFPLLDGRGDLASFVALLADRARQAIVVDRSRDWCASSPALRALPLRAQLCLLHRSVAALLRPADVAPVAATLFLDAPVHALLTWLNFLIEGEVGRQRGEQLKLVRRGSSQRQNRQRSKGASEDSDGDEDQEGQVDANGSEGWCGERTWTLALYELATNGAAPVRRDVTDLRAWRAIVAEIAASVLEAPHGLVAALAAPSPSDTSAAALRGASIEAWAAAVAAGGGGEGYLLDCDTDALLAAGASPVPRVAFSPEAVRLANVSLAALAFDTTAEASFFEPAGLGSDGGVDDGGDGGGGDDCVSESAKLGQIAEAVELLTGAERQASEARADAMMLVAEAAKAAEGAKGPPSGPARAKTSERLARAKRREAAAVALWEEQCEGLTQALALLIRGLAQQVR